MSAKVSPSRSTLWLEDGHPSRPVCLSCLERVGAGKASDPIEDVGHGLVGRFGEGPFEERRHGGVGQEGRGGARDGRVREREVVRHKVLQEASVVFRGRVDASTAGGVFNLFAATVSLAGQDLRSRQAKTFRTQPLDFLQLLPVELSSLVRAIAPPHRQQAVLPLVAKRIECGLLHPERTAYLPLEIRLVLFTHDRREHEREPLGAVPVFIVGSRLKGDWRVDEVFL